ncbi:hypothetical protein EVG20_g3204 [Dentipellis fragilis]|uniref:Uncharacterized protein n=1 Tax=Dentipellis fragilis TaxID=205917 RepID=A0A4Y9Z432_9AGAM|nr:hypothetical protein EVG20_g3204 [Dentipellis fragilis]
MEAEKDHFIDDKIDAKANAISVDKADAHNKEEVGSKAPSLDNNKSAEFAFTLFALFNFISTFLVLSKPSVEDIDYGLDDDDNDEFDLERDSDDPEGELEEQPDESVAPSILERFQPRGPPKKPISSGRPKPKPKPK